MSRLFLLLPILLLTLACQEIDFDNGEEVIVSNACGVDKPLEELPWLKEIVDEYKNNPGSDYCQVYQIVQGLYQGESVFIIQVSGALCCTCAGKAVYNCEGEAVFVCEPEEEKKIRELKVIWSRDR
ncbi:hypothetical protein OKW21_005784 [Catalinimonas alkaloidigena]|uniref:hypothetical protein n=1 Tax=Catalinimonas alkaloidigena TaxID=1075417 RepID=UPI002404FB9F|nr:hypothetical protein [Catalinimonas alkaloidigena]MDF9800521.1 hypothetical protein [Catalinimonas alkaloidigena]